ncbi:MAG: alpha-galactosidase [Litoreibacter sp.]
MTKDTFQAWRLDDGRQTLVLAARDTRMPEVVYWGMPLPQNENLATLVSAHAIDVTGGMLDAPLDLSICPEVARSFPGHPGLSLRGNGGEQLLPKFNFTEAIETDGSLTLRYADDSNGLRYSATFDTDAETHVITSHAVLEADRPVYLNWLSAPVLPAPQYSDEMIDFAGRWCGEFQLNHTNWTAGMRCRENRTGRTGHEHFPGLIVPCRGATNTQGQAYAFHYGWSGGHKMVAEELPDGRRQIQFGHMADTETEAAMRFETAPLYVTYSADGLNGCSVAYQRHLRKRILHQFENRKKPVHYNCWESVYFDHKIDLLKDIASRAAKLGAERFVLDDGWFGKRDDDTTSLGDWQVDPRKFPDGLGPLIEHVRAEGMSFGLWFEPEMINPKSALYRKHPEWVLGPVDQSLGRQQKVLNMAMQEVGEFLYARMSELLSEYDIEYIKWDHNRVLPISQANQIRGTYALLDRLRTDFPDVEIESCASGGGRIDFGILKHTQRVWLSDSNDALERLRIQHNASLFLPMTVTGSHVGPRKCHTSGRVLDITFRAWVAAQRHLGFEMDPRELDLEETRVLTEVTQWWKRNRDWLLRADILRLDSADPAVIAEQQMCETEQRFVVFAGKAETSRQIAPRPLCLAGLDPSSQYSVTLVNRDSAPALSRGRPILKGEPIAVSGAYLMNHGLSLPWSLPETMWVLEGERL